MKKSKFSGEQIVRILKEIEAGAKVGETSRKHGISESTHYVWKSKYAGMEVSQLRHLKDVESELAADSEQVEHRFRRTPNIPLMLTMVGQNQMNAKRLPMKGGAHRVPLSRLLRLDRHSSA